jgi:hypothetical protein
MQPNVVVRSQYSLEPPLFPSRTEKKVIAQSRRNFGRPQTEIERGFPSYRARDEHYLASRIVAEIQHTRDFF